jgi:DNA-binding transcriptional LysR family regulator
MHEMNQERKPRTQTSPERIDLNLLRVFDAVFEDQNLLRAGKRLNLSQSAISHAISRLRDALDDELFVRTAKGMEPTARALAIAAPLREALRSIHDTLGVKSFDPATASRVFVLAANDYLTSVLLTRLSGRIAALAPSVDLVIRPSTRLDLAEQIDVGRIDLVVGIFAKIPSRYQSVPVWTQNDMLLMRKGHPLRRRNAAVEDLADYPLITVSVGGLEEGAVSGYINERGLARQSELFDRQALEDALRAVGRKPRYGVTSPHSLVVAELLEASNMIAIVPSPLVEPLVKERNLHAKALPYEAPSTTLRVIWHRRFEHDPAHMWLRGLLLELADR